MNAISLRPSQRVGPSSTTSAVVSVLAALLVLPLALAPRANSETEKLSARLKR